jgi:hypothetical protein
MCAGGVNPSRYPDICTARTKTRTASLISPSPGRRPRGLPRRAASAWPAVGETAVRRPQSGAQERCLRRVADEIEQFGRGIRFLVGPDGLKCDAMRPRHNLERRGAAWYRGSPGRLRCYPPRNRSEGQQPRIHTGIVPVGIIPAGTVPAGTVTGIGRRAGIVGPERSRPAGYLAATQSKADQNPDRPSVHDSSRLPRTWAGDGAYRRAGHHSKLRGAAGAVRDRRRGNVIGGDTSARTAVDSNPELSSRPTPATTKPVTSRDRIAGSSPYGAARASIAATPSRPDR